MEKTIEIEVELVSKFKKASSVGAKEVILFFKENEVILRDIEFENEYYSFKLNVYFDYGKCLKHIGNYEEAYQVLTDTLRDYDHFYKEFRYYKNKYILSVLKSIVTLCNVMNKCEEQRIFETEYTKRAKMTSVMFYFRRLFFLDRRVDILDDNL